MVDVFREVRRVLRDDATAWVNLGDSYASTSTYNAARSSGGAFGRANDRSFPNAGASPGYKPKDLMMIPAQVALALRADGWWLRKDIIWHKPAPMPESCTDRPTSSHEHVFLLSKSADYFYDGVAIAEPSVSDHASGNGFKRGERESFRDKNGARGSDAPWTGVGTTRNARDVWTINSQSYAGAHFATMPPGLAERCILAGTSEHGCCSICKAPFTRIVERGEIDMDAAKRCGANALGGYHGTATKQYLEAGVQVPGDVKARILEGLRPKVTVGWSRSCSCDGASPVPCTVLDPFGGSGTTALVADRLRRNAILVELNAEYAAMAEARVTADAGMFSAVQGAK